MASITIRNLDGDVKNRSLQQRPHHQQVVAPDELIPPARPEGVALIALVGVEKATSSGPSSPRAWRGSH